MCNVQGSPQSATSITGISIVIVVLPPTLVPTLQGEGPDTVSRVVGMAQVCTGVPMLMVGPGERGYMWDTRCLQSIVSKKSMKKWKEKILRKEKLLRSLPVLVLSKEPFLTYESNPRIWPRG